MVIRVNDKLTLLTLFTVTYTGYIKSYTHPIENTHGKILQQYLGCFSCNEMTKRVKKNK